MVDFVVDETPELRAWRAEINEFFDREIPNGFEFDWDYDEDDEGWEETKKLWRKMGARGWATLTWPREYYGLGRPAIDKWILHEEIARRNVPESPGVGLNVASPPILRLGTDDQRKRHLKGIASGEVLWGEGFTEPEAGSDLASLETHAVRDGDHWLLNGQKTFGTGAHRAQWMIVFARTNPSVPKHVGLSCFLVPTDAPGLTMQPLHNLAGGRQNQTFFDNVRVPVEDQLGEVDRAWQQVWFRQGGDDLDPGAGPRIPALKLGHALAQLMEYCRETKRNGVAMSADPLVRAQLADLAVGVEAIKILEYEEFWRATTNNRSPFGAFFQAMVIKEFEPKFAQTCMEIMGPLALIRSGRWAPLAGAVQHGYRASFGNHAGGTSQVKRMIVATRGLGLPR